MLFPISTLCLVICLAVTYSRYGQRNALTLALAVWAFGVLLVSVPIFEYVVDYSPKTDLFVAACLAAATLTYHRVRQAPRSPPTTYPDRRREMFFATALGIFGLLGCLILLADAVSTGTELSVSYLLGNLTTIRTDSFDRLAENVRPSPLVFVGNYLAACAYLSVIAAARVGGLRLVALGAANFVLISFVSLFVNAGRATMVYVVLLVLVSMYLGGKRLVTLQPRRLLLAAAAIIAVAYLGTTFFEKREASVSASPAEVLEITQRASLRPWIADAAAENRALESGLVSVGYFASPLPTLAFYMQREPLPGPYFGGYSYPLPTRTLGKMTGNGFDWIAVRNEVFDPLEAAGYAGNVWATWLRDLLVDFGYIGTVIYCAAFAALMAWTRNRFEQTGALHYHYFEVLACFTLAFGAFASVVWYSFISSAFFTAIVVMFVTRVHIAKAKRAPAARQILRA